MNSTVSLSKLHGIERECHRLHRHIDSAVSHCKLHRSETECHRLHKHVSSAVSHIKLHRVNMNAIDCMSTSTAL